MYTYERIIIESFFLWYFVLVNIVNALLLFAGSLLFWKRYQESKKEDLSAIVKSESLPEIAFLIPAYNESASMVNNVYNILSLSYRYKKIIVINDGSTDQTLALLQKEFDLKIIPQFYQEKLPTQKVRAVYQSLRFKEVFVVDKEHGFKFDAIMQALMQQNPPFFSLLMPIPMLMILVFKSLSGALLQIRIL